MSGALGPGLGQPDTHRVADRLAIADLLATYCIRLDEYDVSAACAVFTDDCVTDYGPGRGGVVEGREATRARIATGQAAFRRTHHQLGQSVVTFGAGHDTAEALSYVSTWHERHDGSRHTAYLRYVDELVRTREGWRVRHRAVHAAGVLGFPGTEWVWVARRAPEPPDPVEAP